MKTKTLFEDSSSFFLKNELLFLRGLKSRTLLLDHWCKRDTKKFNYSFFFIQMDLVV